MSITDGRPYGRTGARRRAPGLAESHEFGKVVAGADGAYAQRRTALCAPGPAGP
ncbi:hypothetical protein ACFH04_14575 [Streptomyces noboritoensis]|uniref:Uncharacterized protein n=1 Tax=Streptomyces noboritoensis TaxID=67337 RepID=A0ABV6THN8_9ACTN